MGQGLFSDKIPNHKSPVTKSMTNVGGSSGRAKKIAFSATSATRPRHKCQILLQTASGLWDTPHTRPEFILRHQEALARLGPDREVHQKALCAEGFVDAIWG